MIQKCKNALVARHEVRCGFDQILFLSCSRISKFARVLKIMDEMGQVGRGALLATARDRRVDQ